MINVAVAQARARKARNRGTAARLTVLSLGAGVQSTTLALMAAHGEVTPMPDCAIFADTGNEKRATYHHIDWLEEQLPYPLVRVRRFGDIDLGSATVAHYRGQPEGIGFTPPFFSPLGKLPIHCSKEWKTRAVIAYLRSRYGVAAGKRSPKGASAVVWIGISVDEAHRMKPCEASWITNCWPLVEKGLSRQDCRGWLLYHDYPLPPRSACVFCPFQDDDEWAAMEEDDFEAAALFDEACRDGGNGTVGPLYLTKHMLPIRDIDFKALVTSRGSPPPRRLDNFGDECEGICGV